MKQRRRSVEAEQEVSHCSACLMQFLDLLGELLVNTGQGRQLEAPERDRVALGAQDGPASKRHRNQPEIDRKVSCEREPVKQARRFRSDRRRLPDECPQAAANEGCGEHSEPEHEVPCFQPLANVAAAREVLAQQDTGISRHDEQQDEPVQGDGYVGVAFRCGRVGHAELLTPRSMRDAPAMCVEAHQSADSRNASNWSRECGSEARARLASGHVLWPASYREAEERDVGPDVLRKDAKTGAKAAAQMAQNGR